MNSMKPSEMALDVKKDPSRTVSFQTPEIGRNYIYKDVDRILSLGVTQLNKGVRDVPGENKIHHSELTVLSPSESQIQQVLSAPDYPLGTTSKRKYLRRVSFPQRYPSLVNLVFTDEDIQRLEETFWNTRKGAQASPAIEEDMREFLKAQAMSKRHKMVKEELASFRKTSKMSDGQAGKKFAKSLTELQSLPPTELMSKSRRRVKKKSFQGDSLSTQSGSTGTDEDVDFGLSIFGTSGRKKTDKGIRKKDKTTLPAGKPKKPAKEVKPVALGKTVGENIREGKTRRQEKFLTYFSPSKLAMLGIDDTSVDVSLLDRKVKAMEQMLAMQRSRKKRERQFSADFEGDSSGSVTPDARDLEDLKAKIHMYLDDEDMEQDLPKRSLRKKLDEKDDVIYDRQKRSSRKKLDEKDEMIYDANEQRQKKKLAKSKLRKSLKKRLKSRRFKRDSKMSLTRKESELLDSPEDDDSESDDRGSLSMFLDTPTVSDPALDVSKIESVVDKQSKLASPEPVQRVTADVEEEPEEELHPMPVEYTESHISPEAQRWKRICKFAIERRRAEMSGRSFDVTERSETREPLLMKVAKGVHSMWKYANKRGSFAASMSEARDDLSQVKPDKQDALKSAYTGRWDDYTEGGVFEGVLQKSERSESLKKDSLESGRTRQSTSRKGSQDDEGKPGRGSLTKAHEYLSRESQEPNETYQAVYGWSRSEDDMPESIRRQLSQEYLKSLQLPWRAHLPPGTGKLSPPDSEEKLPGDKRETEEYVASLRHKKFLEREAARSANKGPDGSDDAALTPSMKKEGASTGVTPSPSTTAERLGASSSPGLKKHVSLSLTTPERQSQEVDTTTTMATATPPEVVVERDPVVVLNELVSDLMGKLEKDNVESKRRKSSLQKSAMQDLVSRGEKFIRDQAKFRERSQSEKMKGGKVRSSSKGADAVADEAEALAGKDKRKSRRLHVSMDDPHQEDSEGRRRTKSAPRKEGDDSEKEAPKRRKDKKGLRETESGSVEADGEGPVDEVSAEKAAMKKRKDKKGLRETESGSVEADGEGPVDEVSAEKSAMKKRKDKKGLRETESGSVEADGEGPVDEVSAEKAAMKKRKDQKSLRRTESGSVEADGEGPVDEDSAEKAAMKKRKDQKSLRRTESGSVESDGEGPVDEVSAEKAAMKKRKGKKSLRRTESGNVVPGGESLWDEGSEQDFEDSDEEGGFVKKSSKISKKKAGTAEKDKLQHDERAKDSGTKQDSESALKSAEGSRRLRGSAGSPKTTSPGDDEHRHRRLSKLQERAMGKDLKKAIDGSSTVAGEHWLSTDQRSTMSTETLSKSIDIFSSEADSQTVDYYPEDDDSSAKKVSLVTTLTSETEESLEQYEDDSDDEKKRTAKKKTAKKKKPLPPRRRKKTKGPEKTKKTPTPPGEAAASKDWEPLKRSLVRLPEVIIDGHRIAVCKPFSGWDFERPAKPKDAAEQPTEDAESRHKIYSRGSPDVGNVVLPGLLKLPEIPTRVSQRTESDIYLRKFGIVELFEYMMVNLVMDRPDQPIDYLLDLTRTIMRQMKARFEMSQLLESTIDDGSETPLYPESLGTTFSENFSFKDAPGPPKLPT